MNGSLLIQLCFILVLNIEISGELSCFRTFYINQSFCRGLVIHHPVKEPRLCCHKFPGGGFYFSIDKLRKNRYLCIPCISMSDIYGVEKRNVNVKWGEWGGCSKTCEAGVKYRRKVNCNNDSRGNDAHCYQMQACQLNQHCPRDGQWSDWNEWSKCSPKCNGSVKSKETSNSPQQYTRSRERLCNNPAPIYNGGQCKGDSKQTKLCLPCNERSHWSKWSKWTKCNSSKCGIRSRKRKIRKCIKPSKNGRICKGRRIKRKLCRLIECPIDGKWSLYSNWTKCRLKTNNCTLSKYSYRQRQCNSPPPRYKGKKCSGRRREKRKCFIYEQCY